TAGHCFHDVDRNRVSGPVPYPTMATIGRTIVSGTGGHDVSVVWVQQSPSTDIALGELASPVTDVTPLALSTRTPKVGEVLRITGGRRCSRVGRRPGRRAVRTRPGSCGYPRRPVPPRPSAP